MLLLFLYASLCDPEYHVREAASARLAHLIDRHPAIYGPRLLELARGATCPEVRSRAARALVIYERWRVNSFVPSTAPVWPICDAYPVANPVIPFGLADVRDRCRWPVRTRPGDASGPTWTAYRRTTEERVRDMLRSGASHEEADSLVGRMWALEQAHRGDVDAARWAVSGTWREWQGGYPRP